MEVQTQEATASDNLIIQCKPCDKRYLVPKVNLFQHRCHCHNKFGQICFSCFTELNGKPKILVEENVYCFFCAKKIVPAIKQQRIDAAESKYKLLSEEYQQRAQIHSQKMRSWLANKSVALQDNPFGFWFGIALIAVSIAVTGPFAILGLIAALCIWSKLHTSREKELLFSFSHRNPEPVFYEVPPTKEIVKEIDHEPLPSDGTTINNKWYQREIIARDGGKCQSCGEPKEKLEVHHIIPRAQDGEDDPTNLITLCCYCHDRERWYGHIRAYPTTIEVETKPPTIGHAPIRKRYSRYYPPTIRRW